MTSASSVEFKCVPVAAIDRVVDAYPEVLALGRAACDEQGDYDFKSDFMPDIRAGLLQLWLGRADGKIEFMLVTRVEQRPKGRVGQILIGTGENRRRWLPFLAEVEETFRRAGAKACEPVMRKGWLRDLPDYQLTHVIARKAL